MKVEEVARVVADHFNVSVPWIRSPRRQAKVMRPRMIVMYLARIVAGRSYPQIGKYLNRDHTSVIHGHYRIQAQMKHNTKLCADIEACMAKLKGGQ
jgi:chromosomal replication initiator protein